MPSCRKISSVSKQDYLEKINKERTIVKEWIKDIAIALVIALVITQFVKPTIVKQSSMEPNFHDKDYLFVSKQAYRFKEPQRGDVVVFDSSLTDEDGNDKLLIKRIIGMPGEELDIIDEKVYINGVMLDETYTMDGTTYGDIQDLIIPEGEYFCMGDNRDVSIDSRDPAVGCVDEAQLVGRVFFRLFPFSGFGAVKNPYNQ